MNTKAAMLSKFVAIPHGSFYYEHYLKFVPEDRFLYDLDIEQLADVPTNFRGEFEVSPQHITGNIKEGSKFQLGSYKLRIIEYQPWMDNYKCVLDNPLAFYPIWRRKLYHQWVWFVYRIIATLRIWGLMRPYKESVDAAVYAPAFPWRDIYAINKVMRIVSKVRRKTA